MGSEAPGGVIRSKRRFFQLWEAGVIGNRPRVWRDPLTAMQSGVPRLGFREMGVPGGQHEIVPTALAFATAMRWSAAGRDYVIDETAPDERNTLQGEVCRTERGMEGYLGVRTGMRMRYAMERGLLHPVRGLRVLALLDTYMDPSSRDDIETLLDLYDGAVIEFACYDYNVGVLPHRNTIVWEVRHY